MDISTAAKEFRQLEAKLHAYNHALGILYYDSVTTAPSDTAEGRGETIAVLTEALYDLTTGEEGTKLAKAILDSKDEAEPRLYREAELFYRDIDYVSSIPKEEYIAYQMLINEAEAVWHRAKADNDFASFAPYLEKIVESNRKFAGYYRPGADPYDVLLDRYERGLTTQKADKFFAALESRIVPLIHQIAQRPQVDDSFLFGCFPIDRQRELSDWCMEVMGIDRSHCGIGETEHPFTINFNHNDVRITTHYHEDSVTSSMFSVIHEGGHALYELNIDPEFENTLLAGGVSMGIHESQSRLFENLIGRSRGFVSLLLPELKKLFPEQLEGVTEDMLYKAVNKSQPSLIRTEADELTYALHIMVRYQLEKALIDGSLKVADLPAAWNAKYKEYLGVDVPDDTRGVLQDSHWSGGSVGYFPSYALGSAYGAQIVATMEKDLNIDETIRKGSLAPVVDWLKEHIFKFGSLYDPDVLLESCCGAAFDEGYFIDYLENKYKGIYGI